MAILTFTLKRSISNQVKTFLSLTRTRSSSPKKPSSSPYPHSGLGSDFERG